MSDLYKQVRNISSTVLVLSALFFVLSIGIGTTYDVVFDPDQVVEDAAGLTGQSNETIENAGEALDAFGGTIDFVESRKVGRPKSSSKGSPRKSK